jgi:hypothetical protein
MTDTAFDEARKLYETVLSQRNEVKLEQAELTATHALLYSNRVLLSFKKMHHEKIMLRYFQNIEGDLTDEAILNEAHPYIDICEELQAARLLCDQAKIAEGKVWHKLGDLNRNLAKAREKLSNAALRVGLNVQHYVEEEEGKEEES